MTNQDFFDLRMRADVLEMCDDLPGANRLRAISLEIAREIDLICYGYQLLWRNRPLDAIEILERNAASNPESWNAWDTLGEAYAQYGDVRRAAECYMHASRLVAGEQDRLRIERHLRDLTALGALAS